MHLSLRQAKTKKKSVDFSVDYCLLTSAVCSVEMCERNSCVDLLVICCVPPVCVFSRFVNERMLRRLSTCAPCL